MTHSAPTTTTPVPGEASSTDLPITVSSFRAGDHADWLRLSRAYQVFDDDLSSELETERTWRRLLASDGIHGLGAYSDDRLVGIAHFLVHDHVWHGRVCYLEDLFVDESLRHRGVGRLLLEHLATKARALGCFRLYWVTKATNAAARRFYDQIAIDTGYVRYDMPLSTPA